MTKRVQFIGHPSALANQFTGLDREITVDYENWELRLHDGVTPGGLRLLNRDQNDDRYQGRSAELDGLLGWEPSDRGFVTRRGPANYALRVIEVDPEAMQIANATGYEGNIKIGLKSVITQDITFNGEIQFAEVVKFLNGIDGNLTGDTTGDHHGDSFGVHTGDVVGDLVGDTAGTHIGNLDTREGTVEMAPGQIKMAWLGVEILDYLASVVVPIGAAIPYFGEIEDIPLNWALCNGTAGTPDLRDRTVFGASALKPFGSTGGQASHDHDLEVDEGGEHSHIGIAAAHALTVEELPAHRHKAGVTDKDAAIFCYGGTAAEPTTGDSIDGNSSSGTMQPWTSYEGDNEGHSHGLDVDVGGKHDHSGRASSTSHLPPYVATNWIMRLS